MLATIRGAIGRHRAPFWVLCLLLILVFLLGGGSRADIESLVVLRPLSALFLGYGVWGLLAGRVDRAPFLLGLAAATVILIAVQLIPLPPAFWAAMPGRDLLIEIDRAAGLGETWRPLSLRPVATWNALFSLMTPLAVLLIGLRLGVQELVALLILLIGLGLLGVVVAALQMTGPVTGPFYLYRFTNPGSAVGLFANRNHQALLLACMIPMLAAWASRDRGVVAGMRGRAALAISIGVILVPLILTTGSRAGLAMLIIGLASVPFLCKRSALREDGSRFWTVARVAMPLLVIALGILTVFLGRADAVDRLLGQAMDSDARIVALGPLISIAATYFPVGSGFGSFASVFLVAEPDNMLALKTFGHAHNDLIELAITGGLPALLLLLAGLVGFAGMTKRWLAARAVPGEVHAMAGAGLWILLMILLASLVDYPLRVPSLACFAVVAVLWARTPNNSVDAQKGL